MTFAIHSIFLIILSIRLEICRSVFFSVLQDKMCAPGKFPQSVCGPKRPQSASSAQFTQACSFSEFSYNIGGPEKFTGNHCVGVSYIKKRLQHRCYSVNLVQFCRIFVKCYFLIFKHPSRNKFCSLLT